MKLLILSLVTTTTLLVGLCISGFSNNKPAVSSTGNSEQDPRVNKVLGGDDDPRPIKGTVTDVGHNALEDVHVELYTLALTPVDDTYTDGDGDYQIDDVLPDTYKLYFNKQGYEQLIRTIYVEGSAPVFEVGISEIIEE